MLSNRPSRRNFLQSGSTLPELNPQALAAIDSPLAAPVAKDCLLTNVRRRAMACDWEVQFADRRDENALEHVLAALDLVESLEDQMTVYRDDSEIIRINRQAALHPVPVEPRLFVILQLTERLFRETAGAFDITSGPLSEVWGFSRRGGRVPSDAEINTAREHVGMQHVVLDDANCTVAFRRPGITINLNSTGKGYALDRMAELLDAGGVADYLLHGGKSSVRARGVQPAALKHDSPELEKDCSRDSSTWGWSIGLRHPLRPAQRLAEFNLQNLALSTSGSGTQFFRRNGRTYGHILDPRTGRPVEGIYSATVLAPTAAEADALSTAFYVMGPDKVADYCRTRPELATLLVTPDNREGEIRLHAFNLDESRWRPLAS